MLPLPYYVALGKSVKYSEPQFLYLLKVGQHLLRGLALSVLMRVTWNNARGNVSLAFGTQ